MNYNFQLSTYHNNQLSTHTYYITKKFILIKNFDLNKYLYIL